MQTKENVKRRTAANKKYFDRARAAMLPRAGIGSPALIREGQVATRTKGRLAYRYAGPFAVVGARVHAATTLGAD